MRRFIVLTTPILLFIGFFQLSGCIDPGGGVSAEVLAKHQANLVLAEEPEEGLQTVADVRNALLGVSEEPHDHADHDHDAEEHAHDDEDHEHEEHDHDAAEHDEHEHSDQEHDHGVLPTEPKQVVMVGTIGGLTNPWAETQPDYPFARRQAMLFVCDSGTVAEQEASGHVHAPGEECAFCARNAGKTVDMIAMVRFTDEEGKTVAVDAQQLFDVKHMDTVVVSGTAHIDRGGLLIVEATGLYVRQ